MGQSGYKDGGGREFVMAKFIVLHSIGLMMPQNNWSAKRRGLSRKVLPIISQV